MPVLRRTKVTVMVAGLGVIGLGLVGCSNPTTQPKSAGRLSAIPSSGAPSASPGGTTAAPTALPPAPHTSSKPPVGPATGVIAGIVTADSQGPCYAVRTSANVDFILYGTNDGSFHKGQTVRATVKVMPLGISCPGGGRQAEIVTLQVLK
jgi:hypothetical protein